MTSPEASICAIARHRMEIDGAGIRSLILFSDCPLRCRYCANPYTWDGSRSAVSYSPESLLEKLSVDSVYFKATQGGITFGGGEPLLYTSFISALIDLCPKEWNFIAETSLCVPWENVALIAHKTEKFIVDIKSMDDTIYHAYTGGRLSLAKENLISLSRLIGPDRITVRVPIIPNYADSRSQKESVEELKKLGITHFDEFSYVIKNKGMKYLSE